MTAEVPVMCPMCGSEAAVRADACAICGYDLRARNNEGGVKCARCGSAVPEGYAFCPVCGLDQRQRLARPPTRVVQLDDEGEPAEEDDDPVHEWPAGPSSGERGQSEEDAPTSAFPTVSATGDRPWDSTPGASPPFVVAQLVLVGRDGEEGEHFPMFQSTLEIGRTHGDLRFPDDRFMSPSHLRVEREGTTFRLVDLESKNGVFLRIRGHAAVYPGDVFMVGHQVLRLENVTESAQEQAPAPDGTRSFGTPLKPAWGKLTLLGRGAVPGDIFFLRGAKVLFGREHGDILFPHDPFVSREHARLRLELHGHQMSVFIEDLGSANGTYVRVRGSVEIRPKDTFRVGDQILRLRLDA